MIAVTSPRIQAPLDARPGPALVCTPVEFADQWVQPATPAAYRRHRPMAERSIAWLTRNKARRVPYRGVAANHLWLTTRAAAVNLVRLTNLAAAHNNGALTL